MSPSPYDDLSHAELARLGLAPAAAASGRARLQRHRWHPYALNLLSLVFVLALPVAFMMQLEVWPALGTMLVLLLLTTRLPRLALSLPRLHGRGAPRVISVLKAPDRLYCPRCGAERASEYCSGCGAHVDTEYRKTARQMIRFIVEGTEQQRSAFEAEVRAQLRQIAIEHRQAMENALRSMEQAYIQEIQRQRRFIAELQRREQPA